MMFQAVARPTYIMVNTAMLVVAGSGAISGRSSASIASPNRAIALMAVVRLKSAPARGARTPPAAGRSGRVPWWALVGLKPAPARDAVQPLRPDDQHRHQDDEEREARPDRRDHDRGDVLGQQHQEGRDARTAPAAQSAEHDDGEQARDQVVVAARVERVGDAEDDATGGGGGPPRPPNPP